MDEKVKKFLDAKKNAEFKRYKSLEDSTLISLGLYEKEYSPNNEYSEVFCFSEKDSVTNTTKYYKKVPIKVTDEEYQLILKYANVAEEQKKNPIAEVLTVIAWLIFIGGFIGGIIFGIELVESGYYYTRTTLDFSFGTAFICWFVSGLSGVLLLGFAEIIKLLEDIKRK